MDRQLATIVDDLESARTRLRALRDALPEAAWDYRADPGGWSAAQCVAHLNLTSAALLPLVREGLDEARTLRDSTRARYRRNLLGWVIWKLVAPSSRLKTATLPAFLPSVTPPVERLLIEFDRHQADVIACVTEAEGLPIDRVTLVSPFHGRLKYNLYAALTLVPVHQHRHLVQAERAATACIPTAAACSVAT